ncbi:MAG: type II secretion system F family protein [Candidatus Coatesbacteria bacterium]
MSIAAGGFALLAGGAGAGAGAAAGLLSREVAVRSWVADAAGRVRGVSLRALAREVLAAAGRAQCAWSPVARLAEGGRARSARWAGPGVSAPAETPAASGGGDAGAWLAEKEALALGGFAAGAWLAGDWTAGVLLGAAAAVVPDLLARDAWRRRQERLRRELPDALDLLGLALEAGLSVDAGLAQVAEKQRGSLLADAIGRMLGEVRFGARRHTAWRDMAARLANPEITEVVGALIQADAMGVGLAASLNGLAEQMRVRRRAQVEELAHKAPVKMLFPLALFIFPALFIVLLGPVFLQLAAAF